MKHETSRLRDERGIALLAVMIFIFILVLAVGYFAWDKFMVRAPQGTPVVEQVATTTLDIALRNPTNRRLEAEVILPVPDGAVKQGENRLTIDCPKSKGPDDIRIGEIRLIEQPLDNVLSESELTVKVSDVTGHPLPARLTLVRENALLFIYFSAPRGTRIEWFNIGDESKEFANALDSYLARRA